MSARGRSDTPARLPSLSAGTPRTETGADIQPVSHWVIMSPWFRAQQTDGAGLTHGKESGSTALPARFRHAAPSSFATDMSGARTRRPGAGEMATFVTGFRTSRLGQSSDRDDHGCAITPRHGTVHAYAWVRRKAFLQIIRQDNARDTTLRDRVRSARSIKIRT